METIKFLQQIPFMLKAKEAEQWSEVFMSLYSKEKAGSITAFNRGTNRFYLLDRMQTPWYMWRKKRHIKAMLNFMNDNHKIHEKNPKEKVAHSRSANKIENKVYSDVDNTVMASNW